MKTKIIAHMGYSQKYPENTLISFRKAKELHADGIELDVHLTSDSVLIVYHDYYLGKNNAGQGLIFNQSSKEIQSLDVGSWFNEKFNQERIPTLQQVFDTVGSNIHYEIELKGFTLDFLHQVINLVKINNLLDNVEFTSPHQYLLSFIKQKYPTIKVGMFVNSLPEWMELSLGHKIIKSNATFGSINVIHCPLTILTEKFVKDLQANKFLVHAINCNTQEDIKKALNLKVNQLSTDKLVLAVELRDSYA